MANRYGVFSKPDCQRIKRVVHTVEDSPRQYVRVPEQVSRNLGGGGGTIGLTGTLLGAWTTSEHDATTGVTLATWYRGPSREWITAKDYDVLLTSDGKILTNGEVNTGYDNGIAVLQADASQSVIWHSDMNGLTAVTSTSGGVTRGKTLIESSDGYYWLAGAASVGRINPTTGEFTHRYANGVVSAFFPCPLAGHVIVVPGNGVLIAILDATATAIATAATSGRVDVSGSVVAAAIGAGSLTVYDSSTLAVIDTRTEAITWGTMGDAATDGTNVYFMSQNGGLRAQLASNLATDVWAVAAGGTYTSESLHMHDGYLYQVYGTTSFTVRKTDPSDGSTVWTSSAHNTGGSDNAINIGGRLAFGTDFIVFTVTTIGSTLGNAASRNVICLNKSDGTLRWYDWDGSQTISGVGNIQQAFGCYVSADDRVFVAHDRKQQ
jgi:hypothetical protein